MERKLQKGVMYYDVSYSKSGDVMSRSTQGRGLKLFPEALSYEALGSERGELRIVPRDISTNLSVPLCRWMGKGRAGKAIGKEGRRKDWIKLLLGKTFLLHGLE